MLQGCKIWKLRRCNGCKFAFVGAYTVNSHCQQNRTARGDWLTRSPDSPSADPVVNWPTDDIDSGIPRCSVSIGLSRSFFALLYPWNGVEKMSVNFHPPAKPTKVIPKIIHYSSTNYTFYICLRIIQSFEIVNSRVRCNVEKQLQESKIPI